MTLLSMGTLISNFNLNEARRYLPGSKKQKTIFGDILSHPHHENIGLLPSQNPEGSSDG